MLITHYIIYRLFLGINILYTDVYILPREKKINVSEEEVFVYYMLVDDLCVPYSLFG